MFKAVANFEYAGACRYTGYVDKSIKLTLECGHELWRKASQGVPKRARCVECERFAAEKAKAATTDICLGCEGVGKYPSGAHCQCCGGDGRVLPGDGMAVGTVQ